MTITTLFEKSQIPVQELPSGEILYIDVYTIDSLKPGPTVYMQSAVHGAEHQGSAVIHTFLQYLSTQNFFGKIIFVPNANPAALNTKMGQYTFGRFNPITGENWNRLYQNFLASDQKSSKEEVQDFLKEYPSVKPIDLQTNFKKFLTKKLEAKLQAPQNKGILPHRKLHLILQKLSLEADIVLDLHTGPCATRYLYSSELLIEEAKYFHMPHTLIIKEQVAGAMDEVSFSPWFYLMTELNQRGHKIPTLFSSYTLELGSEERISFEEAKSDCSRILNYLNHKGMEITNPWSHNSEKSYHCLIKDFTTYHAQRGGLYDYLKSPGDTCKKGDIMAKAINFKNPKLHKMAYDFIAPNDCVIINRFASSSVSEGAELFQVMENYSS